MSRLPKPKPESSSDDAFAGFNIPPELMRETLIEGFARALERRMQGESMDALLETMQVTADLRLFKESLFLTPEQVCRMLQISPRTFDEYKKKLERDNHIGPGCTRIPFFSILAQREKSILEAPAGPSPKARKGR